MYAPALIPRERVGAQYSGLMHISDWYSTFCHLAGLDSTECTTDGFNQWEAIIGTARPPRTEVLFRLRFRTRYHAQRIDSLKSVDPFLIVFLL